MSAGEHSRRQPANATAGRGPHGMGRAAQPPSASLASTRAGHVPNSCSFLRGAGRRPANAQATQSRQPTPTAAPRRLLIDILVAVCARRVYTKRDVHASQSSDASPPSTVRRRRPLARRRPGESPRHARAIRRPVRLPLARPRPANRRPAAPQEFFGKNSYARKGATVRRRRSLVRQRPGDVSRHARAIRCPVRQSLA